MTFYYRSTVTKAFSSVQYIMTEAIFGRLIRSVHRWSTSMMVLIMILHVFCVYLTGGIKQPHELSWLCSSFEFEINFNFSLAYSLWTLLKFSALSSSLIRLTLTGASTTIGIRMNIGHPAVGESNNQQPSPTSFPFRSRSNPRTDPDPFHNQTRFQTPTRTLLQLGLVLNFSSSDPLQI